MQAILTNWKTSLAGVIIIALGAANTFLGVHVPGFDLSFASSIPIGVGLMFSSDGVATPAPAPAAK
jgi:galactokinase